MQKWITRFFNYFYAPTAQDNYNFSMSMFNVNMLSSNNVFNVFNIINNSHQKKICHTEYCKAQKWILVPA